MANADRPVRSRAVDLSVDAREFHLVLKQAKEFDRKIYLNLRRELRAAAAPAAADVRAEVMKPSIRLSYRKHVYGAEALNELASPGERVSKRRLREHIAKGVKVQIAASEKSRRVGVFIVSKGSDPGSKMLKRVWDQGRWRHPVFADAANKTRKEWKWVPQYGRPYFGSVVQKRAPQIEAAVRKSLADTVAQLPKK